MSDVRAELLARTKIDEISGCWNWVKAKDQDGYGSVRFGGKQRRAHRVSYEVHIEPVPRDARVCHRCDNPACINPAHLFLGSQAENISDMVAKGRQARGQRVSTAKLNESDIFAIRDADGGRGLHTALAKKHGVSSQQIADIRAGKCWAHLIAPELRNNAK